MLEEMSDMSTDLPLDAEEQAAEEVLKTKFDPAVDVRSRKKEAALTIMQDLMVKGVKTTADFKRNLAKFDPSYGNLDDHTIWRYKQIIANRNLRRLQENNTLNQTTEQIAIKLNDTLEMINAEFWKIYHDKNQSAHAKIMALKEIRDTMKDHLKIMQSLGLIHEAPTKVQQVDADGNVVTPLGSTTVEKAIILQGFTEFMNTNYRDPLPSDKQLQAAPNQPNMTMGLKNEGLQGA